MPHVARIEVGQQRASDRLNARAKSRHARQPRIGSSVRPQWLDSILTDADMCGDSRFIRPCAAWRKGELLGGEAGAALIRQAEQELRQRGAKDPVRFARMYSPGFD